MLEALHKSARVYCLWTSCKALSIPAIAASFFKRNSLNLPATVDGNSTWSDMCPVEVLFINYDEVSSLSSQRFEIAWICLLQRMVSPHGVICVLFKYYSQNYNEVPSLSSQTIVGFSLVELLYLIIYRTCKINLKCMFFPHPPKWERRIRKS